MNNPEKNPPSGISLLPNSQDLLEILIVTSKGKSKRIKVPGTTRKEVLEEAKLMYEEISTLGDNYFESATKIYEWLIAPIEAELDAQQIANLVFVMPAGLRALPLAALYDEKTDKFLVEKYSIGLIPSINLVDTRYRNLKNSPVLAFGASEFTQFVVYLRHRSFSFYVRILSTTENCSH